MNLSWQKLTVYKVGYSTGPGGSKSETVLTKAEADARTERFIAEGRSGVRKQCVSYERLGPASAEDLIFFDGLREPGERFWLTGAVGGTRVATHFTTRERAERYRDAMIETGHDGGLFWGYSPRQAQWIHGVQVIHENVVDLMVNETPIRPVHEVC